MAKTTTTAALGFGELIDLSAYFTAGQERVAPTEFRLFVFGTNRSDQGDFVFDQESAEAVMEEWGRQRRDLVIDYEHQSLAKPPIKAPAAGWFVPEVRPDGLWATIVRWTSEARNLIETAQYRFFSPGFQYETKTGRIIKVINAGLTNNPSLYGLPALVAASSRPLEEDTTMPDENEKIATLTAQVSDLTAKLNSRDEELRHARGQTATAQLSAALGLAPTAKIEEIQERATTLGTLSSKIREITGKDTFGAAMGVIEGWQRDAAQTQQLLTEKKEIETAACKSEVASILDKLATEGKVPPAKREWYEKKALSVGGGQWTREGVEWLKNYTEDLPVIVGGVSGNGGTSSGTGAGGSKLPEQKATGMAVLSQNGVALARLAGNDPDKVNEFVAKEIAAGRLL